MGDNEQEGEYSGSGQQPERDGQQAGILRRPGHRRRSDQQGGPSRSSGQPRRRDSQQGRHSRRSGHRRRRDRFRGSPSRGFIQYERGDQQAAEPSSDFQRVQQQESESGQFSRDQPQAAPPPGFCRHFSRDQQQAVPPPGFGHFSRDEQPAPPPGFGHFSRDEQPAPPPGFGHFSRDEQPAPPPGFGHFSRDEQPAPPPGFGVLSRDHQQAAPPPGFDNSRNQQESGSSLSDRNQQQVAPPPGIVHFSRDQQQESRSSDIGDRVDDDQHQSEPSSTDRQEAGYHYASDDEQPGPSGLSESQRALDPRKERYQQHSSSSEFIDSDSEPDPLPPPEIDHCAFERVDVPPIDPLPPPEIDHCALERVDVPPIFRNVGHFKGGPDNLGSYESPPTSPTEGFSRGLGPMRPPSISTTITDDDAEPESCTVTCLSTRFENSICAATWAGIKDGPLLLGSFNTDRLHRLKPNCDLKGSVKYLRRDVMYDSNRRLGWNLMPFVRHYLQFFHSQIQNPEPFLNWLRLNPNHLIYGDALIITTRDVLAAIMSTPYDFNSTSRWIICAKIINKKIHLYFDTPPYGFRDYPTTQMMDKYLFNEAPQGYNIKVISKDDMVLHGVYQLKLELFNVLYSSYIPGLKTKSEVEEHYNLVTFDHIETDVCLSDSQSCFVETNRARILWTHMALTKARRAVVGFRSADFINQVVKYKIKQLRGAPWVRNWDPKHEWIFLEDFLRFVVSEVLKMPPKARHAETYIWKFYSYSYNCEYINCELYRKYGKLKKRIPHPREPLFPENIGPRDNI